MGKKCASCENNIGCYQQSPPPYFDDRTHYYVQTIKTTGGQDSYSLENRNIRGHSFGLFVYVSFFLGVSLN